MMTKRITIILFILMFIIVLLVTGCTPPASTTTYTISATAGIGGSISPAGSMTVTAGDNQSFTITPDIGYNIADVLVDGETIGIESSYTFTDIQKDHTIQVTFAQQVQNSFIITATSGTGGNIIPKGSVEVDKGDDQSFTITPNTGYEIDEVFVDGSLQGPITTYTFQNIQKNHSIQASFSPKAYTLTLSIVPYSEYGVAVSGAGTYQVGQAVSISVATDSVRTFDYWYDQINHNIISYDSTYEFTMPANDVHYAAYWHYSYLD